MEQRPLRLGDNVDDYCPRERRITNHVIVALVGEAIRQTRCTTCDADHVYRAARMPRRKKQDAPAALYEQVLSDVAGAQPAPPRGESDADLPPAVAASAESPGEGVEPGAADQGGGSDSESGTTAADGRPDEVWSAHRPLIRATLPRTGDEPPTPRPIPEFTMHQRRTRGGQGFRQGWQGGNGHSRNGFRPGRSAHGQGQGNGPSPGNGPSHGRPESGGRSGRRHGPKNKRPR